MTLVANGSPLAFITLGVAGSGKSTVSRELSRMTGAAYLDKDTVTGPLVEFALNALGQDPSDRESNQIYLDQVMPVEYETLFALARQNLALGNSVVLDAPFVAYLADPAYLETTTAHAKWPETDIRIIHVHASEETIRQRLLERDNHRDRAKLGDWEGYWHRFGGLECQWRTGVHEHLHNEGEEVWQGLEALLSRIRASAEGSSRPRV
ncbi:AAA family ATPase [Rothia halotolerans]|uniref:AAA family ATPase n=1 Tax=Rothia halotolerans TaxID=405770 RepID=UPI00101D2B7A|nr:ATP-binding protein [Rothia halotolerans]